MLKRKPRKTSGPLRGKGVITNFQREIIGALKNLADLKYFYLTGGTALSEFHFAHRLSYDLDIFTVEKDLVLSFSRKAEELKNKIFSVQVIRRFSSFAEFELTRQDEKVRLHFAYDSPFRFENPEESDLGIMVNDYQDIIVDKLLAFFGRAEPRDAVDLFFILKKENIEKLSQLAVQKDPGFDLYWLAVALKKVEEFPDEISKWPVEMLLELNVRELKDKFHRISHQIMDKLRREKG